MKIAFDHQAFTMQRFGGVSRCFNELAIELDRLDQEVKIFAGIYQNHYLSKLPSKLISGKHIDGYPKKTGTVFNYFNHFLTQSQIKSFSPDVVHETYYAFLKPARINAARVVSVYDMIHELFPDSFKKNDPLTRHKTEAFKRADHIISISQSTKNDLVNLLGISPEKITVIPLAANPLPIMGNESVGKNPKPFLFYVGDRSGYKNFQFLLKGIASSSSIKANFDLVAFGGGSFKEEEIKLITALGFSATQVRQESGSDEKLASLYQSAKAFIYPSVYEGFGLPPLEAMSLDCPVISSNSSSMPEVIGDAGEFFNPMRLEELIQAMENVVFSEERRKELIEKGRIRLQNFSWRKNAIQTLEVYRQLL